MNTNDLTPPKIDRTESNAQPHTNTPHTGKPHTGKPHISKQPYVVPVLENLGDYALTIGQVASLPVNP